MSRSKNTKLYLFAFDTEPTNWNQEIVYQLDMPEVWRMWIHRLRKRENDYALVKRIAPLGDKLLSIFPDLVGVNNRFYQDGNKKPWLLAVRPIPADTLFLLVKAWFLKQASDTENPPSDEVQLSELQWKKVTVNEACQADKFLIFQLVPALVGHRFCESEKSLALKTGEDLLSLRFSKVFAKRETDCMSQPITTTMGDQFSYVVRFRLKTRGGEPDRYMLHTSFGIRRFKTKPVKTEKLKGKIHSTLLVSMDNPFTVAENGTARSYASLSYRRQGWEAPFTRWKEGLDELFSELLLGRKFNPEEILTNPSNYGEGSNPRVLIVHNQQIYRSHPVGAGISIEEKKRLFELVMFELSDWAPIAPMSAIPKPVAPKGKVKQKHPPLHVPHKRDFVLEIWGPDTLYDQVIQSLSEKKYIQNFIAEEQEPGVFRLAASTSNRVILVKREQEGYVDALDESFGEDAYTHRANCIRRNLDDVKLEEYVTLALVEILPKQNWEKMWDGADPKLAVREGFRRTGRLSQFIYPAELEQSLEDDGDDEEQGSYKHKVFNAIMDLLSDAGVVDFKPLREIGETRPILAFDLIQVDHGVFPVLTKYERGELFVKGEGMEEWRPLQQAILSSHMLKPIALSIKQGKKHLTRWLEEQLSREKLLTEAFILLIGANLRWYGITALTNANVSKDRNPPIAPWIQEDPNVTVIRINATDEVPVYGFNPLSMSTGVYSDGGSGVYYGIGSKGISQRKISKDKTKFHNPRITFQQPLAVEYMPMGAMEDSERERLAWIVHWLREMCISFETTVKLPYPLKMLKSLEKYMKRRNVERDQIEAEFV